MRKNVTTIRDKIASQKQEFTGEFQPRTYCYGNVGGNLFNALRWVASATSKDAAHISFNGLYVTRNEDGELQLIGTDGRRMHILTFDKGGLERDFTLPEGVIINVKSTKKEVAFTHLIDATFPDYKRVIPNNSKTQFHIEIDKKSSNAQALFDLSRAGSLINPAYIADLGLAAESYNYEWTVTIDNPSKAVEFKCDKIAGLSLYALIMPMQGSVDEPTEAEKAEREARENREWETLKKAHEKLQQDTIASDETEAPEAIAQDAIETEPETMVYQTVEPESESAETVAEVKGIESARALLKKLQKAAARQKNDKVRLCLTRLSDGITDEKLAEFIQTTPCGATPCAKWSVYNRFIVFLACTNDARGYKQWQLAGRKVKKGSQAFYILVPCATKGEDGKETKTTFRAMPVFRIEDTEPVETEADKAMEIVAA